MQKLSRRNFNIKLTKGVGGAALAASLPINCMVANPSQKKKLGIALVGLGGYSTY